MTGAPYSDSPHRFRCASVPNRQDRISSALSERNSLRQQRGTPAAGGTWWWIQLGPALLIWIFYPLVI